MKKKEFFYQPSDGKAAVHAVIWEPETKPAAILQIAHGVTEYIERYEKTAKYFVSKGFVVAGNDARGHGATKLVGDEEMIPLYPGPEGSFDKMVSDIFALHKTLKRLYPDIPCVMLGFSMGSFLIREYLIKFPDEADGAILAGTSFPNKVELAISKCLADQEVNKHGDANSSALVRSLMFENYNKKFRPNKTEADWLCANTDELILYLADEKCSRNVTNGLFREMAYAMNYTGNKKNIERMNKNLPICLISGKNDPVGKEGKGVRQLCDVLKKAGIEDVEMTLFN